MPPKKRPSSTSQPKPAPSKSRPRRTQSPRKTVYKERDTDSEGSAEHDGHDDFEPEGHELAKDIDSDHLDSDFDEHSADVEPPKKKIKGRAGLVTTTRKLQKGPNKGELVEAGLIAPFTMDFLKNLSIPECNDREWLTLNDQTYRRALQNWKDFVEYMVPKLIECDWTLPKLPSKDLLHRLHRDVRFSNDKTPYKKNFSAGFSRTGKKGPWAGYYIHIQPGDKSLIAGGIWSPEKNELATIRSAIIQNSKPLKAVINSSEFIKMFGKPEEGKGDKKRQSIFGHDDMLKNCPKLNGVDKSHPDINLLRLKTIAAVKTFPDSVVLSKSFMDEIVESVKVLAPLVQCINDMILPQSDDEDEGE